MAGFVLRHGNPSDYWAWPSPTSTTSRACQSRNEGLGHNPQMAHSGAPATPSEARAHRPGPCIRNQRQMRSNCLPRRAGSAMGGWSLCPVAQAAADAD